MTKIDFLKTGIKNLKTVGALARSSKFLCKKSISFIDFEEATLIVELGAGDGVVTKHLLANMRPDAKLFAFEIMPNMAKLLHKIKDDRLVIIEDSAVHLPKYLAKHNIEKVKYISSAIPFVMFPEEEALEIIQVCHDNMEKGGIYMQIHYSLIAKKLYQQVFGNVDTNFVPINVPPAWVLVSKKQ
ncbi:MAG: phospholipid N-methyltransferase [Paraglaciecola sp.]|jgi:phospholipid N-methyltransferase